MFQELSLIKTRRQRLGIKQKELAEKSGVSQSLIAKLEKGKLEPSYSVAVKIFRALDSFEHRSEKKCRDIMTSKLIFVRGNEKVEKASDLMKKYAIDQLPVIQGESIIGSISESIIFSKIMEFSKDKVLNLKVEDIMQEPYPTINASMPISVALPLLKNADAVMLTENRKLIGILTKANLI